jgi:hypothetical protein
MKETFDAIESINELILTRAGIFSRLGAPGVRIDCTRETGRTPTKIRTPIPAKIAFAGGNA